MKKQKRIVLRQKKGKKDSTADYGDKRIDFWVIAEFEKALN